MPYQTLLQHSLPTGNKGNPNTAMLPAVWGHVSLLPLEGSHGPSSIRIPRSSSCLSIPLLNHMSLLSHHDLLQGPQENLLLAQQEPSVEPSPCWDFYLLPLMFMSSFLRVPLFNRASLSSGVTCIHKWQLSTWNRDSISESSSMGRGAPFLLKKLTTIAHLSLVIWPMIDCSCPQWIATHPRMYGKH